MRSYVQAVQDAYPHERIELWTTGHHRLGWNPVLLGGSAATAY
jgi:hypothetical protein